MDFTPIPAEGYAVVVLRSQPGALHRGELYEIGLRDPLPVVPVPLREGAADVPHDLPGSFRTLYVNARYRLLLDYTRLPDGLSPVDAEWVQSVVAHQ